MEGSVLLKCGICFSSFLIEFESRIEIIKRRTVLTERRCFAPPKILSAGTPNCRGVQAAALPPYHDEGIALVSRVVKMSE